MRKKVLCLVMTGAVIAGTMTVGTGTTVYAEDFTSQGDWSVTFNGDGMESSFSSQEMADEIYGILPGDSIELKVNVQNDSQEDTDWYMSNEVIKSLEEGSTAQGGAYGYQLRYVNAAGEETVLFDSDTIGGDEGEEALQEVTGSLEDYFYLDRLGSDQGGTVYLTVALDGETQGNDYQDTLGRLQMNFAVEEVEPNTVVEQGEDNVINRVVKKVVTTAPRTGDPTQMLGLCAAALVSGIVLLILAVVSMKRRRDDRKGDLRS